MADNPTQNRPASREEAPNPAHNYERSKPERESPQGSLQPPPFRPDPQPDRAGPESTSGRHTNVGNADSLEYSTDQKPLVNPDSVQHSMKQEEPDGWDQAPARIDDPEQKRHSRTDGKGGVP